MLRSAVLWALPALFARVLCLEQQEVRRLATPESVGSQCTHTRMRRRIVFVDPTPPEEDVGVDEGDVSDFLSNRVGSQFGVRW